ncbi:MAG: amino acid permease [Cyanobacteriota bacterium]
MSNSTQSVKKPSASVFKKKDVGKMLAKLEAGGEQLKKTLGAFDLTILGIGAIIGAGIFTLSGTAAAGSEGHVGAGPALILSFVLSGIICGITALCYAEFASMIPVAGSAYTYTYTTLGEIVAFIVGWVLILGYGIGSITVACGWSGYLFQLLRGFEQSLHLPHWLVHPPFWMVYEYKSALVAYETANMTPDFPMLFGIPVSFNLPALFIIIVCTYLLYIGIQESARMAAVMVLIKLVVIFAFIVGGAFFVQPANWSPFMPNGFTGVVMGAFLVFFAYMGFDMVATTAEETKNPSRDLPIGIITSLVVCTIIYILVAAVLTGMVPWNKIDTHSPIATAMAQVGINWAAGVISIGAVAGLSSVILVQLMAVTRVLFAMARDGLLPKVFSKIHNKYHTPHILTICVGSFVAICTFFIDINKAAELCNIGTLTAFTVVCAGIVILRYTEPHKERPFRMPLAPALPTIGALMSSSLIIFTLFNTESPLLLYYAAWLGVGISVYFIHGRSHSTLKAELEEEENQAMSAEAS